MTDRSIRVLAGYLLITTTLTFYLVYTLWSARLPVVTGELPKPDCGTATNSTLTHIFPSRVDVGATTEVWLLGCRLTKEMTVKFNTTEHAALPVDGSHIRVGLAATDVTTPGTIVIGIWDGTKEIGSGPLSVVPSTVTWEVFGTGPQPISQEVQLLLMVLFTGAFGASIYALKSLSDYRGEEGLCQSWFLFYLVKPVEGAGIAFLMYMVIRGGFLTGTGADVKTVNQFGVCAIAGLAGAFSDIAFLKLREVFQTLFKPRDDRGDKLGIKITSASLPDAVVGTQYQQTLQASGGTAPLKWSITPALPAGLTLNADTGTITGIPTTASPKTNYKVTVVDSGLPSTSNSTNVTLAVNSGLKITTAALPNAIVGTVYKQTLQASGGTPPLKWSVQPVLPAPLSLDRDGGIISGTPNAASPKTTHTFTVTDSADPAVSSSAQLSLEIT